MIPRADAEAAWIAWLADGGYPQAATRIPQEHHDGMIRVSRVGGQRLNVVQDRAEMLAEVWHSDAYAASELAHQVAARVEAARDGTMLTHGVQVRGVATTGPLEFPDPNSALKRYQFTFAGVIRRTA